MSRSTRMMAGADRLQRRLQWLRGEAGEQAAEAVAETAAALRDDAQGTLRRAPGGLSRLAETVVIEGEDVERTVVVRHPAAPYVEFGTSRLPPRPFLQPAADTVRVSFRKRIAAGIVRLLRARS